MSGQAANNHGAFIWSVADLLRGVYKQSEYGRVILPLTVLRRLDCVLGADQGQGSTKSHCRQASRESLENRAPVLAHAAGQSFYNTSKHTFTTLLADPDNVAGNLRNYIAGFSESARDIIDKFNFDISDRPFGRTQPAVSGGFEVRRPRSASRQCFEPGDGLHLRGADPAVL